MNAHAPTAEKDTVEHDTFYHHLSSTLQKFRKDISCYVCGDFNAVVGRMCSNECAVGSHGNKENRSESGARMVEFCEMNDLFICNTAFKQRSSLKWTHRATDRNGKDYFRQIDFILCRRRIKGLLSQCRTHGGTVLDSDHRLLVARVNLRFFYG